MPRDKYDQQRLTSTDLDLPPLELEPVREFNYTKPWPERHFGQKFGPSLVRNALKAGFYVLCEIDDVPNAWAVDDARWVDSVFEVHCLQGWKVPSHVWTTSTLKGLKF